MNETDLRTTERKVFRFSIDHGVWDIYLGCLLLAMGLSALFEDLGLGSSSAWFLGLMIPALIFFYVSRKYLIEPRLGRVRFGARRKTSLRVMAGLIGLAVLVGLGMWWASASLLDVPAPSLLPVILWVVLSLGSFSLAAYLLGFPRLYLYGLFFVAVFTTLELIPTPALRTLPTIAAGAVILLIGSLLFARFLRNYPLPVIPDIEETHGPHRA